jgi:hypothetical protein
MKPESGKILIAIPFWSGDKAEATALARLLSDLEPERSSIADLVFVSRSDCKHDKEIVGYAAKKFNTFTASTKPGPTGWPRGCNSLFFGTIDWCLRGMSGGKLPKYRAIFNCAADSVPLVPDGVSFLHKEWVRTEKQGINIAGAMVPTSIAGTDKFHINGDCTLISGNLEYLFWLSKQAGTVMRRGGGWDWLLAPQFEQRGWANIPEIQSHYRRPPLGDGEFEKYVAGGTKWLHGIKGTSLIEECRRKLL